MKKKLLLFSLLFIITSVLLVRSLSDNINEDVEIDLIVKGKETDFWRSVASGARDAAKDFSKNRKIHIRVSGPDREEDYRTQQASLGRAIEKRPDLILLAPGNAEALDDLIDKANTEKIPVVLIDSLALNEHWVAYVGSDNKRIGIDLAEEVSKRKKNAKVGVVNFVKEAPAAIARENGFVEGAKEYGLTIKGIEYCDSDEMKALEIVKKMISNDSSIDTVVGLNAQSTLGAARGVSEMGINYLLVGGVDGTFAQAEMIVEGLLDFTVVQNPYQIGYYGVEEGLRYLTSGKTSNQVIIDNKIIDKSNIYDMENQQLIFPFD